ncbi:MAG: hypothetical protein ACFFCW_07430 [Candidatus Hodarchaeota archaeon]
MKVNLAILYVEYDQEKYKDSFVLLQKYLEKIKFCNKIFFIVDNRNEGDYIVKITKNMYKVGGDNSNREFSGWQKGLDILNSININYHLILFVNEAFLAPGKSYLEDYASIFLLLKSLLFNSVIGRIDSHRDKLYALGYDVSQWVCTNCFFVPKKMIDRIDNICTIDKGKINDFIEESFSRDILVTKTLSSDDLQDGRFTIESWIPQNGIINLLIESNKSFIPKERGLGADIRELSVIIRKLKVNENAVDNTNLAGGWYPEACNFSWIGRTARAILKTTSPANLIVEGYIPPNIFHNIYNNKITLTISTHSDIFKKNVNISQRYQELIIEWLAGRWHSKFQMNETNFKLFKEKARAILNESLLTARIKEKGGKIKSYGRKKYY